MKRRDFMKASGLTCIAGTMPLSVLADNLVTIDTSTNKPWSLNQFKALLNQQFLIHKSMWSSQNVKLTAVQEESSNQSLEQFTIIFSDATRKQPLTSDIYWLSHPGKGDFQLYLDVSQTESGEICYRASFSLLA